MQKGISEVISLILIIVILVVLVTMVWFFAVNTQKTAGDMAQREQQRQQDAQGAVFRVENIAGNEVDIRNMGTTPIGDIAFYINNVPINATGPATIAAGTIGVFKLDAAKLLTFPATATLRVATPYSTREMETTFR
jgi:flagellin-like protein